MRDLLSNPLILMEAAILEPLRRAGEIALHPTLANAPLIYSDSGRTALASLYREYLQIAVDAALPILLCAPTWRANRERVLQAGITQRINRDAVGFLRDLTDRRDRLWIGGLLGCRNDCYRPDEALTATEAEAFHTWQSSELAAAGADFLLAATLPSVDEALGMARAMAQTGKPYLISFVIGREGRVLDGSRLDAAISRIDSASAPPPLGYMINCAYPTFLCADGQPGTLFRRLIGYQANASALDHCELDGAGELQAEAITDWGEAMLSLNRKYGIRILGGCCGTQGDHLRYLAQAAVAGGQTATDEGMVAERL